MIEYSAKNAKRWAVLGERPVFGQTVMELAKDNSNIIVITADAVGSAGLERMKNTMPDRVINVGIAEQNMMGIATGLASEGFEVITATFAPFQAMRCLEHIRVNQGYMKQKVIMAGLASGVAYGELGHTHTCIEDVSLLRSIPNIAVVVPSDCMEAAKAVEAAVNYDTSVYIRLMDKTNIPVVNGDDYDFRIGKAVRLREGGRIAVIANGPMVRPALDAADELAENGTEVSVYNMHTVKPVDRELLDELSEKADHIITVEEHNITGGLGSAAAEYMMQKRSRPMLHMMGIPDEYCHGASHETILKKYDLTKEGIAAVIKTIMEE